jgi:hypothetical protein
MFGGKTLGINLHKHGAKQTCNKNLERSVKDQSKRASMGKKKNITNQRCKRNGGVHLHLKLHLQDSSSRIDPQK